MTLDLTLFLVMVHLQHVQLITDLKPCALGLNCGKCGQELLPAIEGIYTMRDGIRITKHLYPDLFYSSTHFYDFFFLSFHDSISRPDAKCNV